MNLKSYSRGIGAGIIVTAVIMGIASNKRTITDEEAINRAKELGYTQSSVLTQSSASTNEAIKEVNSSISDSGLSISQISVETDEKASIEKSDKDDTSVSVMEKEDSSSVSEKRDGKTSSEDKSTSTGSSESSVSNESSVSSVSSSTSASASDSSSSSKEEVEDPVKDNDKPVTGEESVLITINKGDSSVTVSRRMYEAGLVESAVEFDKFLCENGYDKYLAVGEYEIIMGLDFDTMAKIITRSKMN